jgi:hypothetical protein
LTQKANRENISNTIESTDETGSLVSAAKRRFAESSWPEEAVIFVQNVSQYREKQKRRAVLALSANAVRPRDRPHDVCTGIRLLRQSSRELCLNPSGRANEPNR